MSEIDKLMQISRENQERARLNRDRVKFEQESGNFPIDASLEEGRTNASPEEIKQWKEDEFQRKQNQAPKLP